MDKRTFDFVHVRGVCVKVDVCECTCAQGVRARGECVCVCKLPKRCNN